MGRGTCLAERPFRRCCAELRLQVDSTTKPRPVNLSLLGICYCAAGPQVLPEISPRATRSEGICMLAQLLCTFRLRWQSLDFELLNSLPINLRESKGAVHLSNYDSVGKHCKPRS